MAIKKDWANNYFKYFSEPVEQYSLPQKFTYPFYYEPHPLTKIASNELQLYLQNQKDWIHDFGIDHNVEGTNIGKMFGVLVVRNSNTELGYLCAFSGKLAGSNMLPGFVPPIYDLLDEKGYFKKEEANISQINQLIKRIETSGDYLKAKEELNSKKEQSKKELSDFNSFMKTAKKNRKTERELAKVNLSPSDFEIFSKKLVQESLKHQYDYKQLRKFWEEEISLYEISLKSYCDKIHQFKQERKQRSAALQQWLFDQYQFLNINKHTKGLAEIFANTSQQIPPAGAGDCAAPKLLQYAFENNMQPIAMAEFWWGQSPSSEIRKHGYFYPSCRGKCEPILGHMLKGMQVDENPIKNPFVYDDDIEIIYEDEDIVAINKPAEFLSVPGKETEDSVWLRMRNKYPEATGPLLVHRLDMSTSGILLVAKNKETHKELQDQFLNKTIKKRYVALLDGIINENEGSIDLPLRVDLEDRPRQLVCYQYGKPAKTHYKVIKRAENRTLVYFFPVTGRTHQLRVHAAHLSGLNTPIVGDDLYGKKDKRLCLHAEYIEFIHPRTGKTIKLSVKEDFDFI